MGVKAQRRFFKHVVDLSCIFCDGRFPLDQSDFRTMNRHGWGCCGWCWENDMPKRNVYIPAERLRAMQRNGTCEKLHEVKQRAKLTKREKIYFNKGLDKHKGL